MGQEEYTAWFPETIGKPVQILYWSANEVVLPILIFVIGFMLNFYKQSVVLFIAYCYFYSKKKEEIPTGYAINFLYMTGLLALPYMPSYFAANFEE